MENKHWLQVLCEEYSVSPYTLSLRIGAKKNYIFNRIQSETPFENITFKFVKALAAELGMTIEDFEKKVKNF